MNGQFVISLDFEKYWGIFDSKGLDDYRENLDNVDVIVDRLLDLSNQYDIKLTFATVGFLFNKNKEDFVANTPSLTPTYSNKKFSPYSRYNELGDIENDTKYHIAHNSILKIKNDTNHEIGTHTYCHYYCMENGQTKEQFEADLKMAIKVAKDSDIDIKSIVFPRNQTNEKYFNICKEYGILSYRGNENFFIYKHRPEIDNKKIIFRALRLLDAYINISGHHIYNLNELKTDSLINIPSSYFLRSYIKKLSFLEALKLKRVKKTMTIAAKKKELYHLWFHPHNFGVNLEENFNNLENIFKKYAELNEQYNFESITMTGLAKKLLVAN